MIQVLAYLLKLIRIVARCAACASYVVCKSNPHRTHRYCAINLSFDLRKCLTGVNRLRGWHINTRLVWRYVWQIGVCEGDPV